MRGALCGGCFAVQQSPLPCSAPHPVAWRSRLQALSPALACGAWSRGAAQPPVQRGQIYTPNLALASGAPSQGAARLPVQPPASHPMHGAAPQSREPAATARGPAQTLAEPQGFAWTAHGRRTQLPIVPQQAPGPESTLKP